LPGNKFEANGTLLGTLQFPKPDCNSMAGWWKQHLCSMLIWALGGDDKFPVTLTQMGMHMLGEVQGSTFKASIGAMLKLAALGSVLIVVKLDELARRHLSEAFWFSFDGDEIDEYMNSGYLPPGALRAALLPVENRYEYALLALPKTDSAGNDLRPYQIVVRSEDTGKEFDLGKEGGIAYVELKDVYIVKVPLKDGVSWVPEIRDTQERLPIQHAFGVYGTFSADVQPERIDKETGLITFNYKLKYPRPDTKYRVCVYQKTTSEQQYKGTSLGCTIIDSSRGDEGQFRLSMNNTIPGLAHFYYKVTSKQQILKGLPVLMVTPPRTMPGTMQLPSRIPGSENLIGRYDPVRQRFCFSWSKVDSADGYRIYLTAAKDTKMVKTVFDTDALVYMDIDNTTINEKGFDACGGGGNGGYVKWTIGPDKLTSPTQNPFMLYLKRSIGKVLYFQVRPFKLVNGKKRLGPWSERQDKTTLPVVVTEFTNPLTKTNAPVIRASQTEFTANPGDSLDIPFDVVDYDLTISSDRILSELSYTLDFERDSASKDGNTLTYEDMNGAKAKVVLGATSDKSGSVVRGQINVQIPDGFLRPALTFYLKVTDSTGQSDWKTFHVAIQPPQDTQTVCQPCYKYVCDGNSLYCQDSCGKLNDEPVKVCEFGCVNDHCEQQPSDLTGGDGGGCSTGNTSDGGGMVWITILLGLWLLKRNRDRQSRGQE